MVEVLKLHPFYPIVDDLIWLEKLISWGVPMMQVRIKDLDEQQADEMVRDCMRIIGKKPLMVWMNDYWQSALRFDMAHVHLGQEDLAGADLSDLHRHKIEIGLSTHNEEELETALNVKPAYIALGPIFKTKLKKMRFAPQGYDRIAKWKQKIGALPLVAIGGLSLERASQAYKAGADSVSVVTDILLSDTPEQRVGHWLELAASQTWSA